MLVGGGNVGSGTSLAFGILEVGGGVTLVVGSVLLVGFGGVVG